MGSINNYNTDNKKVKICKNCDTVIYWNQNENSYFEVNSQQKHKCPNWKSSITKSQEQLSQNSVKTVDTTEKILAEILLKIDRLDRKLDKLGAC